MKWQVWIGEKGFAERLRLLLILWGTGLVVLCCAALTPAPRWIWMMLALKWTVLAVWLMHICVLKPLSALEQTVKRERRADLLKDPQAAQLETYPLGRALLCLLAGRYDRQACGGYFREAGGAFCIAKPD